jgi:hypothetical protein
VIAAEGHSGETSSSDCSQPGEFAKQERATQGDRERRGHQLRRASGRNDWQLYFLMPFEKTRQPGL